MTKSQKIRKANRRRFYLRHKEKLKAKSQAWRRGCSEHCLKVSASYRAKNATKIKAAHRKKIIDLCDYYVRKMLGQKFKRSRQSFTMTEVVEYRAHMHATRAKPKPICTHCGGHARKNGFNRPAMIQIFSCLDCGKRCYNPAYSHPIVLFPAMPKKEKPIRLGKGATIQPGQFEIDWDNPYHVCKLAALMDGLRLIEEVRESRNIAFDDLEMSDGAFLSLAKYVDKKTDHFASVNFPNMERVLEADTDEPIEEEAIELTA